MNGPLSGLVAGTIFGIGLSISGMSDPEVVLSFLTLSSHWNPALLAVMASAIAVAAVGYVAVNKRATPLFDEAFHLPERTDIDTRLILGAVVFGVGWGLAGYCPGPAIVGAFTLDPRAWIFLPGFVAGMLAFQGVEKARLSREGLRSPGTPQLDDA
jgi:uncharacterized membrane protein YedE/YeeE